jgi:hypothetical protein
VVTNVRIVYEGLPHLYGTIRQVSINDISLGMFVIGCDKCHTLTSELLPDNPEGVAALKQFTNEFIEKHSNCGHASLN